MVQKLFLASLVVAMLMICGSGPSAQAQERKSGTLTGVIKSKKPTPNGRNVILEVLAPGEEEPRPYRVNYSPEVKGPLPKVLEAVKASNVGDQVRFDWVDTGEGLGIKSFEVVKKAEGDKK
jgi:hypothetical protein